MAFLTVAGIDLRVIEGSAHRRPDIWAGGRERMAGMNIISTEDNPQKIADCDIDLYSETEELALRTAVPRSEGVAITGTWLGAFTAIVDVGDATPWVTYDGALLIYKTISIHIEEVQ